MGMGVVEADFPAVPVKDGTEGDVNCLHENDIEKMNQELGLCESREFRRRDAVDEFPTPKQTHSFYFIKYPSYEDPKLKSKIEKAEKKVQKSKQAWLQITEAIKAKECEKWDKIMVLSHLRRLTRYSDILNSKRNRIDHQHQALVKLRNETYTSGEIGDDLCSSEEELNYLIRGLHFQTQRGCNTLVEEKQILGAIQQLEGTREKVIANAAKEEKIYWKGREYCDTYKYSWKQEYRERLKEKPLDLDGVRKEKQLISIRIKNLKKQVKAVVNEISSLQMKLTATNLRKNAAYEGFAELEKQNADYYQNCSLLNNARELAAKKNIAALEELSHSEDEKFMSLWSSSKAFRDDYVRRILPSLNSRQLSRDGRMRNHDGKALVSEFPSTSKSEMVTKFNIKRPKEDSKLRSQHDKLSILKVQKEDSKKFTGSESTAAKDGDDLLEVKGKVSEFEKPQKEISAGNEIDAAKLKEMKTEEEIAKANVALECKKKLAAKVVLLLQDPKGAEKKLRERVKRSKKKKRAESDVAVIEQENTNVKINTSLPSISKEQKTNATRHKNLSKCQDLVPKLLIKRKKLTSHHWLWAAPVVSLVALLLAHGYYLLTSKV